MQRLDQTTHPPEREWATYAAAEGLRSRGTGESTSLAVEELSSEGAVEEFGNRGVDFPIVKDRFGQPPNA